MTKPDSLIPLTLLTGFLGSGKTTLLNHLLSQAELADTLVIINEFGAISLDHLLVTHSVEEGVIELESGCVCCTIRGDLSKTLRDSVWRFARGGVRQFKRVILETTGLADPAPIIHTLINDEKVAAHFQLDAVITVIDAVNAEQTLDAQVEAIKQVALADRLILSKQDLTTPAALSALRLRLQQINPSAEILSADHGQLNSDQVMNLGLFNARKNANEIESWLNTAAYLSAPKPSASASQANYYASAAPSLFEPRRASAMPDVNRHDDQIRAFSFVVEEPIPMPVFADWLDTIMAMMGKDMLRIKAILQIEGQDLPMVIHGVQHIFHPPITLEAWPSADHHSRLVFITRNISQALIENSLKSMLQAHRNSDVLR